MICSGRFSSINDGGGTCTSGRRRLGPEGVGTTSGCGSESMTPATAPRTESNDSHPMVRPVNRRTKIGYHISRQIRTQRLVVVGEQRVAAPRRTSAKPLLE